MYEEPIEEAYFNWLCAKVLDRGAGNHYELLRILHSTEFVWVVPADKHRAEDGIELRRDFLRESGYDREQPWEELPCSILELFISFANRASFQTDISAKVWFWEFMTNLHLERYDRVGSSDRLQIEDILYNLIWRQYEPDGYGGMFPLSSTKNDQRKVEIWYQFCEYLIDRAIF